MSSGTAALAGLLVLATAVWVGGYVAIAVVSKVADRTLPADVRVVFFRRLGQTYAKVSVSALAIALAIGGVLLGRRPMDGRSALAVVLAAALLMVAVSGMIQARRMGTLRREVLESDDDAALAARLRRGAVVATLLRAAIGVFSLALLAVGVWLGVH
jgi:hypothetical protein